MFFADLSPYAYMRSSPAALPTRNVGWLDASHEFPVDAPSEALLERLWQFCMITVMPTRGLHYCPFCEKPQTALAARSGTCIVLGSAEIRVFEANGGAAFAAPNLLYHYVAVHHYLPPPEFLAAVESGPLPAEPSYGERLTKWGLPYLATPPQTEDLIMFRFVKRDDGTVEREETRIPLPKA